MGKDVLIMGRTRMNGLNLQGSRFRLGMRKTFLTIVADGLWNSLSRAVMGSPSLEVYKPKLGSYLLGRLEYPALNSGLD